MKAPGFGVWKFIVDWSLDLIATNPKELLAIGHKLWQYKEGVFTLSLVMLLLIAEKKTRH